MEKLKKYIEENRDLFDDKNPSEGHMERFEALLDRLPQQDAINKPARKFNLIRVLSVAASIAILIGVAFKFYAPHQVDAVPLEENTIMLDEFRATNDYYNQKMEAQIADIMCKLAHTDTENQAQLTADLQRIVDNNADFVNEMAKNQNQEIALRYLVKHYKANIQVLENINQKLGKFTKC